MYFHKVLFAPQIYEHVLLTQFDGKAKVNNVYSQVGLIPTRSTSTSKIMIPPSSGHLIVPHISHSLIDICSTVVLYVGCIGLDRDTCFSAGNLYN